MKTKTAFVLAILLLVFLSTTTQTAIGDDDERQQGRDFARDFLWPILQLFSFKEPIFIGTTAQLLNFFSAFLLIYFVMGNLLSSGGMQAVLFSLLIVSYMSFFLVVDWYPFFMDMAPAVVAYFLAYDLVSMMATVTTRNAKLISLFAFGTTYFLKPTRELFDSFFRQTFASMVWVAGPAFVLLIMALRMASVVVSAMHTGTALQARYSMRQAREAMLDKLLFEKYK